MLLCFISRLSVRVVTLAALVCVGCVSLIAVNTAHASIWLAHQFQSPTTIRAITVDHETLSLIVSSDSRIDRIYPDEYLPSFRTIFETKESMHVQIRGWVVKASYNPYISGSGEPARDQAIEHDGTTVSLWPYRPDQLAPLPGDRFIATDGSATVTLHDPPFTSSSSLRAATIIIGKKSRPLSDSEPQGKHLTIKPSSIATNNKGEIFVGGYAPEADDTTGRHPSVSRHDDSNSDNKPKYVVWQLRQDGAQQWHAQPIAYSSSWPQLISTRADRVVLLDSSRSSNLLPQAAGKLRVIQHSEPFPHVLAPWLTSTNVVGHGDDGTIFISDSKRNVVRSVRDTTGKDIAGGQDVPWDGTQLDPLKFKFTPGVLATASGGGVFVEHKHYSSIRFIGPDDDLEGQLTSLVNAARDLASTGALELAGEKIRELKAIADDPKNEGMRAWRVRMALKTLDLLIDSKKLAQINQLEIDAKRAREAKTRTRAERPNLKIESCTLARPVMSKPSGAALLPHQTTHTVKQRRRKRSAASSAASGVNRG